MRKAKATCLAACSLVLVTAVHITAYVDAHAADLRAPSNKAPAYHYPSVPVFSWTGFYAGVNAGYGWSRGDGTIAFGGASGDFSGSGNGFLGGIQAGYNWQTGPVVFGVETDFQGSTAKSTVNATAGATSVTGDLKAPWGGTIRGRIGYAWDRWMVYVTGGAAYGKLTYEGTVSTTGAFSASSTYWTWTLGGGVETALWDRWSVKLEYLYGHTPDTFPSPPGTTDMTGNLHSNVVRAGLNYRF